MRLGGIKPDHPKGADWSIWHHILKTLGRWSFTLLAAKDVMDNINTGYNNKYVSSLYNFSPKPKDVVDNINTLHNNKYVL